MACGNSDVRLAWANDARTVRSKKTSVGEVGLELVVEPSFVMHRDAFGDHDHQFHPGLCRFHNRTLHRNRGHEDNRRCAIGCFLRVGNAREDRHTVDFGARLLWVGTTDDFGAVLTVEVAVVTACASGQPLVDDLGVLIEKNCHCSSVLIFLVVFSQLRAIRPFRRR